MVSLNFLFYFVNLIFYDFVKKVILLYKKGTKEIFQINCLEKGGEIEMFCFVSILKYNQRIVGNCIGGV